MFLFQIFGFVCLLMLEREATLGNVGRTGGQG
jgi:hypothetical protein